MFYYPSSGFQTQEESNAYSMHYTAHTILYYMQYILCGIIFILLGKYGMQDQCSIIKVLLNCW